MFVSVAQTSSTLVKRGSIVGALLASHKLVPLLLDGNFWLSYITDCLGIFFSYGHIVDKYHIVSFL